MDQFLRTALTVDVTAAAHEATNAAVDAASRRADLLLGGRPLPGTERWRAEQDGPDAAHRERAAQLLRFRIELKVGIDPIGSLVGLRRWGVTWELIARAAGISRQAAHERWGRRVSQILDGYGTGELGGPPSPQAR